MKQLSKGCISGVCNIRYVKISAHHIISNLRSRNIFQSRSCETVVIWFFWNVENKLTVTSMYRWGACFENSKIAFRDKRLHRCCHQQRVTKTSIYHEISFWSINGYFVGVFFVLPIPTIKHWIPFSMTNVSNSSFDPNWNCFQIPVFKELQPAYCIWKQSSTALTSGRSSSIGGFTSKIA